MLIHEGGNAGAYTIVLDSRPIADVMVTPRVNRISGGGLSRDLLLATVSTTPPTTPPTLIFTPSNWNMPQTVTVTAVDDDIDIFSAFPSPIDHAVTSSDSNYDGLSAPRAWVLARDNDSAGIMVSDADEEATSQHIAATASVATPEITVDAVDEAQGTITYTVRLTTEPIYGPVTIAPMTGDDTVATVSPTELTFTSGNWQTPQMVTLTGVPDDFINDPARTTRVTHGVTAHSFSSYTQLASLAHPRPLAPVVVTVSDDDTPAVTVSETALTVTEGLEQTYTIALATGPAGEVTITPTSSDPTAVTVMPTALTFNPTNWETPQTVRVIGVDNNLIDGSRPATISHGIAGGGYDDVPVGQITVTAADNDTSGITLSATTLTLTQNIPETYTVTLTRGPTGDVTITPTSSDPAVVTVTPTQLTFTPQNWQTPQPLTVTSRDNTRIDGGQSVSISHRGSGGGYDDVGGQVTAIAANKVILSTDGLSIAEADSRGTYTVVLNNQPTSLNLEASRPAGARELRGSNDVTVRPRSNDGTVAAVSPAELIFTPSNWNQPQTVTVTTVDDPVDNEPDRTTTISHQIQGGGFDLVAEALITITALDDDGPPETNVSEDELTVAEAGGVETYTVVLKTPPAGQVIVRPVSSDPTAVTVSPAAP